METEHLNIREGHPFKGVVPPSPIVFQPEKYLVIIIQKGLKFGGQG